MFFSDQETLAQERTKTHGHNTLRLVAFHSWVSAFPSPVTSSKALQALPCPFHSLQNMDKDIQEREGATEEGPAEGYIDDVGCGVPLSRGDCRSWAWLVQGRGNWEGNLIDQFQYLKGVSRGECQALFHGAHWQDKDSGHKLKHSQFHLNRRKNFTPRRAEPWNSCLGRLWNLPFLETPQPTCSCVTCSRWPHLGWRWSPKVPSNSN